MVRGANRAARTLGRAESALADLTGQLRHQVSERDLPYERLARQVVTPKGPQPLDVFIRDERLCAERAHENVTPLGQHTFGSDADRASVASHEHPGELHDGNRVLE